MTNQEMLKKLLIILGELESGTVEKESNLESFLQGQASVYNKILGDNVPEKYWERLEDVGIF